MSEHPTYYAIIPANVRYDKKLLPQEKLMFGEITCLSNKFGYCTASNSYFAKLYATSEDSVSRWISNLKKHGYIKMHVDRAAGNKRRIYMQSVPSNSEGAIGMDADRLPHGCGEVSAPVPVAIGIDADIILQDNIKTNISKQQNEEYDKTYKKAYSDIGKDIKLDTAYYKARNKVNKILLKDYTFDEILEVLPTFIKTKKDNDNLYLMPLRMSNLLAKKTHDGAAKKTIKTYDIQGKEIKTEYMSDKDIEQIEKRIKSGSIISRYEVIKNV